MCGEQASRWRDLAFGGEIPELGARTLIGGKSETKTMLPPTVPHAYR